MGSRPCRVCNEAASKYKCPSCLVPYCSHICYKKHKEVPCTKPVSSDNETKAPCTKPVSSVNETKVPCTEAVSSDNKTKVPCTEAVSSDNKTTIHVLPELEEKPFYVDEPNEALDESQLEAIASCSEIRDALKNDDFRKLISTIDSSDNAEEEFEKAMGLDVFRIFTDKVLSSANQ